MEHEIAKDTGDKGAGGLDNFRSNLYEGFKSNETFKLGSANSSEQSLPQVQLFDSERQQNNAMSGNGSDLEAKRRNPGSGSNPTDVGTNGAGTGRGGLPPQQFPEGSPASQGAPGERPNVPDTEKQNPGSKQVEFPQRPEDPEDEQVDEWADKMLKAWKQDMELHKQLQPWRNATDENRRVLQENQHSHRHDQFSERFGSDGDRQQKMGNALRKGMRQNQEALRKAQLNHQVERQVEPGGKKIQNPMQPKMEPLPHIPFLEPQPSPLDHPRRRTR